MLNLLDKNILKNILCCFPKDSKFCKIMNHFLNKGQKYNFTIYVDKVFDNSIKYTINIKELTDIQRYSILILIDKKNKIYQHNLKIFNKNDVAVYDAEFFGIFSEVLNRTVKNILTENIKETKIADVEYSYKPYAPKKIPESDFEGFLNVCVNPKDSNFISQMYCKDNNNTYILKERASYLEKEQIKSIFQNFNLFLIKNPKKILKYTVAKVDAAGNSVESEYIYNRNLTA
ncbi:MAG TPA: hypothetical protein PLG34_10660 [Spirochaetota bacterium]|jgi:hypothetical protein|nr:hypothetical protein [Spirochaetota bacterium]HPY88428.1 hypothetical protein [Spirochaetota bacterium]